MKDNILNFKAKCPFCGKFFSIPVKSSELENYIMGENAQTAFKSLTVTERESIISNLCPDCQDKVFGKDE